MWANMRLRPETRKLPIVSRSGCAETIVVDTSLRRITPVGHDAKDRRNCTRTSCGFLPGHGNSFCSVLFGRQRLLVCFIGGAETDCVNSQRGRVTSPRQPKHKLLYSGRILFYFLCLSLTHAQRFTPMADVETLRLVRTDQGDGPH